MKTLNNLMNPNNWLTFNGYKLFPHLCGKCVKISRVHCNVILIVKKKNVAFYLLTMCYFTQFYLVWNFHPKRRKRFL